MKTHVITATVCLAVGGVVGFMIGYADGVLGFLDALKSTAAAAWLQAFGGLGAFFAAVIFGAYEHRRAERARREAIAPYALMVKRDVASLRQEIPDFSYKLHRLKYLGEAYPFCLKSRTKEITHNLVEHALVVPRTHRLAGAVQLAVGRLNEVADKGCNLNTNGEREREWEEDLREQYAKLCKLLDDINRECSRYE